jgi:hypothetical protein
MSQADDQFRRESWRRATIIYPEVWTGRLIYFGRLWRTLAILSHFRWNTRTLPWQIPKYFVPMTNRGRRLAGSLDVC